ncbi:hypothetical protein A2U01_0060989, partial [Trifolium medium]|nr:hypothetical protein [Trifolium medium]
ETLFWKDLWIDGDMLMEDEGIKKIKWRWRRRLFQWEEEMVDVCSGLVLGAERLGNDEDCRKWNNESYM